MDLLAAYWSVPLRPADTKKTAFTVGGRKYEFEVMPFGLRGAPATYCHLINLIFRDISFSFVLTFLDDLLCYTGDDFDLHLKHLSEIFTRLRAANLKLKLSKCCFGADQAPYLGHIVSRDGLKTDPKKIAAVKDMRRPTSKKEVKSFLGLAGYYRDFVPNFSLYAEPLHRLTKTSNPRIVVWTEDCERAFQALKDKLTTPPVLAFPDFNKPFIVETDASTKGLGAVLMQETSSGQHCVISYASRVCSSSERNYSITELECLGVVYALQQFRFYLLHNRFKLITDHQALRNLKLMKNPSGRLARWVMFLQEFDYDVEYRKAL
jgi:hypothetical protein